MNNFQINLLSDEEAHADAPLTKRSLMRVALPVVPVIILVVITLMYLSSLKERREYRELKQANAQYHERKSLYEEPAKKSREMVAILNQLQDWQHAQLQPEQWLSALPGTIPNDFQVKKMSMDLKMGKDKASKRYVAHATVMLDCVAAGHVNAEAVQKFVDHLETSEFVTSATEYGYRESVNPDGTPGLRSFRVTSEMREIKAP